MTGSELAIGGFGICMFLRVLLSMIYSTWAVPNRGKPWIATGLGILFSLIACYATEGLLTFNIVVAYCAQGFVAGAAASGFYEMTKKA